MGPLSRMGLAYALAAMFVPMPEARGISWDDLPDRVRPKPKKKRNPKRAAQKAQRLARRKNRDPKQSREG